MRCFQGIPINIDQPIIGRITNIYHHNWLSRYKKIQILVVKEQMEKLPEADAYVTCGFLPNTPNLIEPCVGNVSLEDALELNDGDVVLMSKDGKVKVIYEVNSSHNVLLATNRCNLKCIMCPQAPSLDNENLLENNLSLIRLMDPENTHYLAITGGEPTMLGEKLFKLIQDCKKYLPRTSLIILSNGKKFNEMEFTRSLALIKHPSLVIAVPLYSDNDRIHDKIVGIQGSFEETVKGIHNLALFRLRVEIRTVIHALNYKRLPKLAEFVYHNLPFAIHVALMGMEVAGLARENIDHLWVDPYEYVYQLEKVVQYLHRTNMNVSIYNHQHCYLPKKLWPFCRKSISEWKNIFLAECSLCVEKDKCCGFFETGGNYYSKHLRPLS